LCDLPVHAVFSFCFLFTHPPTTSIYPLSLHDALPIFSAGTISAITDAVADAVLQWQNRPLEEFYLYLDAIRIKVRQDHRVVGRSAYIAVGVDLEGVKHVLGIWVQDTEGA